MYSKTVIVGHLGRDPEMRFTSGGQSVTSFSVATNRRWTDQSGQTQEKVTWFRVTAWGKLGELCNQYLSKGRVVLVEGDVEASAWKSQEGEARATLELTARNVRFIGGRDMVVGGGDRMQEDSNSGSANIDEEEIPF
ncbi:MAG: single-stranded DNA-binding protein [Anaerolineae bacterium]|nr:single-stranded DNA-binding protein [Anaerolineae bacterium]MCB0231184.1 single-stranded DNA-binding protein [Anaerolineae bacterium]MCB0234810.1 single-stranded DNA-binding protein [Anaerolineae bacterium]MCB0251129.1 single-stranded DNA-binding protein [Anaerolineae bacterium]MCO5244655.1 single-stranded DNA-binding protein [Anaerolineae bacterium]